MQAHPTIAVRSKVDLGRPWRRKLRLEQPPRPEELRVSDLIEELRESKRGRLKPSSFAALEHALDRVIGPQFGHLTLAEVTATRIEQLVRELEQRLAATSVARYLSPMNEILNRAVQHGAIVANPWATLVPTQRPKRAEQRVRFQWSHADLRALLEAARRLDARGSARQSYHPLIATLAFTGCRVGEALALRWCAVDLVARTISISHSWSRTGELTTPKTRAGSRTIPIPDALHRILSDAKPAEAAEEQFCFPARHGAGPISYWNFRQRGFVKALERAGLADKGVTIHDLRHCAASLLIASGISDVEVAAQLGHSSANVTRAIYAHVFDGSAAHQRVRNAFGLIELST